MKLVSILIVLFASSAVLAAGGGGTVMDLKFPFINFLILFGFLAWKLRKPLSNSFNKYRDEVQQLFSHAEEKDKEAQLKLDMFKDKLNQVESVTKKIKEEAQDDVTTFKTKLEQENTERIQKLEKDSKEKVEYEKNMMVNEIEKELLDQVVAMAKTEIGSNKATQAKATEKLLQQL